MHDRQAFLVDRLVIEQDRRRLIVVLQHVRIVLHLIDEGEFYPMALKLDGHTHFPAGIRNRAGGSLSTSPSGDGTPVESTVQKNPSACARTSWPASERSCPHNHRP